MVRTPCIAQYKGEHMSQESQRSRDLARALALRNNILGALRAAAAPMSVEDLCGMSSIVTLYHKAMLPKKVAVQIRNLVHTGEVTKVDRGQYSIRARGIAQILGEPE